MTAKVLTKFWGFTALFGVIGALAAVATGAASFYFADQGKIVQPLTLMFWPSSSFELGDPTGSDYRLYAFSLAANAVLYMLVGAFIWLGVRKNKAFFIVPALSLAVIWWRLLGLK